MASIRRDLLSFTMLALVSGSIVVTGVSYVKAAEEVDELYKNHLRQITAVLRRQATTLHISSEDMVPAIEDGAASISDEEDFLIQVWRNGVKQYSSHAAIALPAPSGTGLIIQDFGDEAWESYADAEGGLLIQVSQPLWVRTAMVREIALRFIVPLFMQLPLLAGLVWLAVGRSLSPLRAVSEAIQERGPLSLEALPQDGVPSEIMPLVVQLNALLQRLDTSLTLQRQFTADAAHELRTPLTAIQLQLEILRRARSEEERDHALIKLTAGISRAGHLVRQLLLLARLGPGACARSSSGADLQALAAVSVEQFTSQAEEKRIRLGLEVAAGPLIHGDAEELQVMLNNLIDNAIRYTPAGGQVVVRLWEVDDAAVLVVSDDGIGIPPEERERVFDRFYRVIGAGPDGTGLGLAIVKSIVERHQARIVLGTGIGYRGTSFAVFFPRPSVRSRLDSTAR